MTAPASGDALRDYLPHGRLPDSRPIRWELAPARYKMYPGARRVVLPWEDVQRDQLAAFLVALSGLTRVRWVHPVDEIGRRVDGAARVAPGRSAPSGGGLYPMETYVATGTALYHYDVAHHSLEELRTGDHRQALSGGDDAPGTAIVVTDRFWRNAFKYRDFGYRLQNQETGILAAQALAAAERLSIPARVHLLFDDERVNTLLGLDSTAESAMAIISLHDQRPGDGPAHTEPAVRPVPSAAPAPMPITDQQPRTAQLHAATMALPISEVRQRPAAPRHPGHLGAQVPLPQAQVRIVDGLDRRSSPVDGFLPRAVELSALSGILGAASAPWANDLPGTEASIAFYCVAPRVSGLSATAYRYQRGLNRLVEVGNEAVDALLADGRGTLMAGLPLGEAAFVLLPVGRPLAGIGSFGDRWYRMIQAEVGVALQRAALAAASLGLAARIHSGASPDFTAALGLVDDTETLSALAVGVPRTGPGYRIATIG